MKFTKSILAVIALIASFATGADAQSSYPYVKAFPNDTTTGTTQFKLAKLNASGNAIVTATSDTNGYTGVCIANCTTSGTAYLAFAGIVPVTMDGTATALHYVQISSTTAGNGHDSGATSFPTSGGDVIGRVQLGCTGANCIAMVDLSVEDIASSSGSGLADPGGNGVIKRTALNTTGPALATDISALWYAAGGGTAQAQTVTLSPAITAYADGMVVMWKPSNPNSGAGPTLAVNGLAATTVTTRGNNALQANDLVTSAIAYAIYNSSGPRFELLNPNTASGGSFGSGPMNSVAVGPMDTPGGSSGSLSAVASPSPLYSLDQRNWVYFNEEFLNAAGSGQFGWTGGGTGSSITEVGGVAGTYGAVKCAISATINGECAWTMSGGGFLFAWQYDATTAGDVIIRANLDTTTNVEWFVGLVNINSGHGEGTADYIGLAYSTTAGDTNWMCVHKNANGTPATSRVSTGIAANTSFHDFRIRFTAAGTFKCSIDGGTEVTNTPTTFTNSSLAPQIYIKTTTATAKATQVDYFFHAVKATR